MTLPAWTNEYLIDFHALDAGGAPLGLASLLTEMEAE